MVDDAIRALAGALGRGGIPWYLFGAQAAILYGVPRMSADIDATAGLAPEDHERLVSLLGPAGFAPRVSDMGAFVHQTRVVPVVHSPSGTPVDIVLAGPGLEEEFLARACLVDFDGVAVPVIAADDLVVTKILAGRPKDLEDVQQIFRRRPAGMDLDRVRHLLRDLETALDRSDLLPALEAARTAARVPEE